MSTPLFEIDPETSYSYECFVCPGRKLEGEFSLFVFYFAIKLVSLKVIPYETISESKKDVFGSQNRGSAIFYSKLMTLQASILGYRLRDGPDPEMGVHFRINLYMKMASGLAS